MYVASYIIIYSQPVNDQEWSSLVTCIHSMLYIAKHMN